MDSDERKGKIKDIVREDELAPVVLFTYNRLEHTKKTVEALQQNVLAADTKLFIYSDAPKNEGAKDSVAAVREYLRSVTGFKKIEIIEREENWGLARNIIDGVTKIVNEYGRIIVLEDDIVTSRYFLQYMNDALRIYESEPQVMAVSSYCWAKEKTNLPETFFLDWFNCWGWATWKDAWSKFERNPKNLIKYHNMKKDKHFNMNGTENMWAQVEQNVSGKIYTWAIFFYSSIYINKGLVLFSNEDLSLNIGMDDSGEHCGNDELGIYKTVLKSVPVKNYSKEYFSNINGEKNIEKTNLIKMDFYRLPNRILRVWENEGIVGIYLRLKRRIINYL